MECDEGVMAQRGGLAQVRWRSMGPLIVAPSNAGYPDASGLRLGPDRILAQVGAGAPSGRPPLDVRPLDLGDGSATAVAAAIAAAVAGAVAGGRTPVVVGGDHTVAVGSIAGVRDGLRRREGRDVPLFLLWLDAHADVNTEATSTTGHLHGMVLAGVLGEGPLAMPEPLPPARVALAGVRALDPGEPAFLQARPDLRLWDVQALRDGSWTAHADELLERVAAADGRLYVSLDLDVVDPAYAPGVAVPAPHGARPGPLLALLRRLRASGAVAGADVVELYPQADRHGRTARLAALALAALGAVPSVRARPPRRALERAPAA